MNDESARPSLDRENSSSQTPGSEDSAARRQKKSLLAGGLLYLVGAALVSVALLGAELLKSARAKEVSGELHQEQATAQAGPRTNVVTVTSGPPTGHVTLLGETHSYLESILYAKISGYLKTVLVDKGDQVKAGQLLATIESPETDAEYRAAIANARNLADISGRDQNLVKRDMVAHQDAETAEANSRVARQDVANLAALTAYEMIRAPFTGQITARYADPGALVQAATNSPVLRISVTSYERLYVYPDQQQAAHIRVGDAAEIADPAKPGVKVAARVTRLSGEFDPTTRTMLTEIDFHNRRGVIPPESMVQVTISYRQGARDLQIPAEALVLRGTQTLIAVVGPDDRISYKPVVVANDDGANVEIRSGLSPGERIAVGISGDIPEGGKIQPVPGTTP
jgi:membrane fusion protein, multidrug efflux system